MAELTTYLTPPEPKPPRRKLRLSVPPSLWWDAMGVSGVILLSVSGWWVTPALGLATLGVSLLIAGLLGARPKSVVAKPVKTPEAEVIP